MNNRIVILGAGESGTGAAVLAKKQGFEVFVSDFGSIKEHYKEILLEHQIEWEEKQHSSGKILNAGEVIKSPGIPEKAEIVKKIRELNIPIINELEFASRYTNATKICITGSNGKTTTTSLIYHLLKKAGLNVGLAGNIGNSFAYQVANYFYDYYVIEVSNFQLDDMYDFKAEIAILLNITPDHLDRYDYVFQRYIDSKFRITRNLTENDYFIFCADDEVIGKELDRLILKARLMGYTTSNKDENVAYLKENTMKIKFDECDFYMSLDELSLKGKHNIANSMAAGLAASVLRIKNEIIRESLSDFKGVEHRLEPVLNVHGIEFINDSKATNVNSTWYALECMNKSVVWIAGGIDKGNDYSDLFELVELKVKALVCLGTDNSKLHKAFHGKIEKICDVQSMEDAVQTANRIANSGDVVLLSPACASFDLFDNYEDRGRQFKTCVRAL